MFYFRYVRTMALRIGLTLHLFSIFAFLCSGSNGSYCNAVDSILTSLANTRTRAQHLSLPSMRFQGATLVLVFTRVSLSRAFITVNQQLPGL